MDLDLTRAAGRTARRGGDTAGGRVEAGVWRTSSHSGDDCVEVIIVDREEVESDPDSPAAAALASGAAHKADYDRLYVVRDSKDPDGPKLYFTPAEWEAFRLGVLDGEFDDLAEAE
jgi:hypothetical protein